MRVATFNIRHGLGRDDSVDLQRTADVITRTGADVVALQEIDRNLARSEFVDQPTALAQLTGMFVHFHATLQWAEGEYGVAMASQMQLDVSYEPLPRAALEEPRGLQRARWGSVSVVATHLSNHRGARGPQLQALAHLAAGIEGPIVVMGDLNTRLWGLRVLTAGGLAAAGGARLDHVLVGGGLRIARAWTIRSPASDHNALIADLDPV
jgi:endonuclease/exonuclease/phosphatase family metal-dependent hydrolase